ncbi:MAG TPA: hypothetical protein VG518_07645, partial [Solirubrobacterales bacterium]|nr:hypothetical protein [Solirubrobacterales bacterium]
PTIDAGTTASPLGALDLDGALRSQPRCIGGTPVPDIGAYEYTPTTDCPAGPPPGATQAKIGFGKLKLNKKRGTATLAVKLPSAGKVKLGGKGVVSREATVGGGKTVGLKIKAKGKKAGRLRKAGKVKLRVKATFTPAGPNELPATKSRAVVLKLQP